jgi:TnpA family transposase
LAECEDEKNVDAAFDAEAVIEIKVSGALRANNSAKLISHQKNFAEKKFKTSFTNQTNSQLDKIFLLPTSVRLRTLRGV